MGSRNSDKSEWWKTSTLLCFCKLVGFIWQLLISHNYFQNALIFIFINVLSLNAIHFCLCAFLVVHSNPLARTSFSLLVLMKRVFCGIHPIQFINGNLGLWLKKRCKTVTHIFGIYRNGMKTKMGSASFGYRDYRNGWMIGYCHKCSEFFLIKEEFIKRTIVFCHLWIVLLYWWHLRLELANNSLIYKFDINFNSMVVSVRLLLLF